MLLLGATHPCSGHRNSLQPWEWDRGLELGGGSGRVPWPCAGSSAQLRLLPAPRTRPVHLPAESRLFL